MKRPALSTSYKGLHAASERATATARASSHKVGTRCELLLRRVLWSRGLRYRIDVANLPGRPDIVFPGARIAVFCDGDFWHGRELTAREVRLARGHNAAYWMAKIRGNVARDREHDEALKKMGWTVLRFWETDILHDPNGVATRVEQVVRHWSG